MPSRPSPAPNTRSTPVHGSTSSLSDKISDSKTEHYEFSVETDATTAATAEHLITVRAFDRFDNVGVAKTVIPAQEQT